MKQWIRSMMLLSVPVVVWGCKSDPTVSSGAGVAAKLVATPSRVFVNQDGSEVVTVTSVDEEGRTVPTTFTLTPPADAGITVTLDTTQQLIYNSAGVAVAPSGTATARYVVAASTFTTSSFTVTSAEGKTITIQVDATPSTLPATFSKVAINLGDTITITAPAGTFFRTDADTLKASMVTFASGIKPIVVSVSADSNTIRIVPGPNDAGVATITNLGVRYNNSLRFTAVTTTGVTSTPAITSAGTVSPTTPALNQTITVTAPPGTGTRFLPTSKVFFADSTDLAKNLVLSADSQSISFIAPPNRTAVKVSVTQVINTKLPQTRFRQTLTTSNTLTTPAVNTFNVTASTTSATANVPVTLTGNANFKFSATATSVSVGGVAGIVTSVSADSLTLQFLSPPGINGPVRVTGGVAGGFALAQLPTPVTSFTTTNTITPTGSANPATAGVVPLPTAINAQTGLFDVVLGEDENGALRQYYQFTPTVSGHYRVSMFWPGGEDIDMAWRTAANGAIATCSATVTTSCQTSGATLADPEVSTADLVAGTTYLLRVIDFGPGGPPPFIGLTFRRID